MHPPLARRFGQILAKIINDNQQLFVVTHNEDILNGLIYGTPYTKFNVLRITRDNDKDKISIMDEKFRRRLRTAPLLLASNTLKSLFRDKIYVTVSFADSALYQGLKSKYDPSSSFYYVNVEGKDKIGPSLLFYDSLNIRSF